MLVIMLIAETRLSNGLFSFLFFFLSPPSHFHFPTSHTFVLVLTHRTSQPHCDCGNGQAQLSTLMNLRWNLTVPMGLDWWIEPAQIGRRADLRVPPAAER